jgi:sporulation protein YlmC with PRC-barrel domain
MAKRFLEQVRGMQVVGAGGHVFGEVVDLELEGVTTLSGIVIRVKSSNLAKLGIRKPFWSRARLVIPAKSVRAMDEVVILRTSLEQFAEQLKAAEEEKLAAPKQATSKLAPAPQPQP